MLVHRGFAGYDDRNPSNNYQDGDLDENHSEYDDYRQPYELTWQ